MDNRGYIVNAAYTTVRADILLNLKQALQNAQLQYLKKTVHGKVEVYHNQQYRWLCINDTIQTVMDLSLPHRLVLPHLHALAMAFYIKKNPSLVIELGLGGGALPRHVQHYFPTARLFSVEIEPVIIECFSHFFSRDTHSTAHIIEQEDAQLFMQAKRQGDIVFIDLFGEDAAPDFLSQQDFYTHCLSNLKKDGLLVLNLLPNHPFQAEQLRRMLGKITGNKTLLLSIPGYKNRVIFASKQALHPLRYTNDVIAFSQAHQVDLNSFMQIS